MTVTILSFDTTAAHCAAALLCGERLLGARLEPMKRGQAEALVPMIEALLAEAGLIPRDLDAIGCGTGPGNFTGIRISVALARGMALSLGVPAIGVSQFELLAPARGAALITLPAPRNMAYAQVMDAGRPVEAPELIDPATWDGPMRAGQVIGHRAQEIAERLSADGQVAAVDDPAPAIARIAAAQLTRGGALPRPAPQYVRAADAAPPSDPPPVILP
ncbi:MAG: tRNA (adenosine(37)-N6)-threonylcarbamoyltransferase complex dimerization subunit type 1 TsaB [Confluentimicrobium sp.]|nr:tRNA (adenosine(37)-N6)-threonylcarbamoyltransferase complex dimerization subunit type 1 TsaB [Actibacterium sp.]|tara:strand:- start:333 stop:986 length:654 start_codon:yes stop_codon:yes gene_type:complete